MMKRQILIVDNDPVISSLLKSFLSLKRYRVECVATGIEALNVIARESFDVIITDMKLMDMSGGDLLRRVRLLLPDIKFIAMSGDSSFATIPEHLKKNTPLLHKPFRLEEMERAIEGLFKTGEDQGI